MGRLHFDQTSLDATVIAIPLLKEMGAELARIERRTALRRRSEDPAAAPLTPQEEADLAAPPSAAALPPLYDVIIDVNLNYMGGNPVGNVAAAGERPRRLRHCPTAPCPYQAGTAPKTEFETLLKGIMSDRSIAARQTPDQGLDEEKAA